MIQELLYTSHEGAGLRKGSGRGFCTVRSSQGMASNLADILEKLSAYKHPFDLHDPRATQNPTNYRHLRLRVGGIPYHVLSRIADLRHEHTGRSNKLAHHLVLPDRALPPAGPSRVLSHPGVCIKEWDGRVTVVPPRQPSTLPGDDMSLQACRAWEKVSGDAGWAGYVADALLKGNKPVYVIFPLGTDTLPLVNEVLSLLSQPKRWETTFSTYFTSLPPGTSCDFRFVLAGTTEAEKLKRDYRQTKVDLTAKLEEPPLSELVGVARTGTTKDKPRKVSTSSRKTSVTDVVADSHAAEIRISPVSPSPQSLPPLTDAADMDSKVASRRLTGSRPNDESKQRWIRYSAITSCSALIVLAMAIIWQIFITTPEEVAEVPPEPRQEAGIETASDDRPTEAGSIKPKKTAATAPQVPELGEVNLSDDSVNDYVAEAEPDALPPASSIQRNREQSPVSFGGTYLSIPNRAASFAENAPRASIPISGNLEEDYSIQILGLDHIRDGHATYELRRNATNSEDWEIIKLSKNVISGAQVEEAVASLIVRPQSLDFIWIDSGDENLKQHLRWCLLKLSSGLRPAFCRLGTPIEEKQKRTAETAAGSGIFTMYRLVHGLPPTERLQFRLDVQFPKITNKNEVEEDKPYFKWTQPSGPASHLSFSLKCIIPSNNSEAQLVEYTATAGSDEESQCFVKLQSKKVLHVPINKQIRSAADRFVRDSKPELQLTIEADYSPDADPFPILSIDRITAPREQ